MPMIMRDDGTEMEVNEETFQAMARFFAMYQSDPGKFGLKLKKGKALKKWTLEQFNYNLSVRITPDVIREIVIYSKCQSLRMVLPGEQHSHQFEAVLEEITTPNRNLSRLHFHNCLDIWWQLIEFDRHGDGTDKVLDTQNRFLHRNVVKKIFWNHIISIITEGKTVSDGVRRKFKGNCIFIL